MVVDILLLRPGIDTMQCGPDTGHFVTLAHGHHWSPLAGPRHDLYQMSSNVTFQFCTLPKFSTLRQIHKSGNSPKNLGRGPVINLITNFARG